MFAARLIARTVSRGYSSKPPPHAVASQRLWKNITFFVGGPAILLAMLNAHLLSKDPHYHDRPPFVPYEYMYIRTKPFPWGDGNHGLFHNRRNNALPEGYEDDE